VVGECMHAWLEWPMRRSARTQRPLRLPTGANVRNYTRMRARGGAPARSCWAAWCQRVSCAPPHAVNQAEDPEKLLDTVVIEMQDDLIKMRQAAAQVRR
jgi:hypothetical protein